MKHQRIVTTITDGHLPSIVRKQIATLLLKVKTGGVIVIEMFDLPTRRSLAQNDGFHAMIEPWAKDEGHKVDELKRDLLGIVFGWEDSPLRESRVPRKPRTSLLTTEEFSELIERTAQIAVEMDGYVLVLPSEYNASKWMPDSMKRSA